MKVTYHVLRESKNGDESISFGSYDTLAEAEAAMADLQAADGENCTNYNYTTSHTKSG